MDDSMIATDEIIKHDKTKTILTRINYGLRGRRY